MPFPPSSCGYGIQVMLQDADIQVKIQLVERNPQPMVAIYDRKYLLICHSFTSSLFVPTQWHAEYLFANTRLLLRESTG